MAPRSSRVLWLCAAVALASAACSEVTTPLIDAPKPANGKPGANDGGDDASSARRDAASLPCGDHECACNNGGDDDGDGEVDGFDPECTGPLDDDERTFGTGHDQAVAQACQDCFWDSDEDSANDGCVYPRSCSETGTVSGDGALACNECSVTPR